MNEKILSLETNIHQKEYNSIKSKLYIHTNFKLQTNKYVLKNLVHDLIMYCYYVINLIKIH